MKLTKMTIFATLVALVSIIMFTTFSQDAFTTPVSANILFYKTTPIPVLYYIAGTFIFGLIIGIVVAINEHFVMAKNYKALKKEFDNYKKEVESRELTSNEELNDSQE